MRVLAKTLYMAKSTCWYVPKIKAQTGKSRGGERDGWKTTENVCGEVHVQEVPSFQHC